MTLATFLFSLQILFIGLKLAGKIDWSWWLVFLPLIIYFLFIFAVFSLIGGFFLWLLTLFFVQPTM